MVSPEVPVPGFIPKWVVNPKVAAWQTCCGASQATYGGFNLGLHVGDDHDSVIRNRHQLLKVLPQMPVWLNQVHGTRVLELSDNKIMADLSADAVMSSVPGVVCAVMTADCLPVLFADQGGRVVGAAHAGWRGLASGVLEALVEQMLKKINGLPIDLTAWIGPGIGMNAFEVGGDVLEAFLQISPEHHVFFKMTNHGKWLADLSGLAMKKLNDLGISNVTQSELCTFSDPKSFYSYRRNRVTGRMASLIWIKPC